VVIVRALSMPEVKLIESRIHTDERGFLVEGWNESTLADAGFAARFVQDNIARSAGNVLRGMHYQLRSPQGKLVRVVRGRIFDVALDMRRSSATFGQWAGAELSDANGCAMWVPPGFAHGYFVLSNEADVLYKCTAPYDPSADRTVRWDDPAVNIVWPLTHGTVPVLKLADANAPLLADAECYP
jgi:dTDP-4-dehydrorhamnose 3,5-epimerase